MLSSSVSVDILLITMGYVVLAGVIPFVLSLLLTQTRPKLRIVSPFWIGLVSWLWFFTPWASSNSSMIASAVFFGVFYVATCLCEDLLTISIMGIATERENIYYEYLTVYAGIDEVRARLMTPEIREGANLSERMEGNAEQGYLFKTQRGYHLNTPISITRNKEDPNITDVKIAYYWENRYNLSVFPLFIEMARKSSAYIKDVFRYREPMLPFAINIPFTNNVRDPLIDRIIDEMCGYYVRSKQLSYGDRFIIASFIGIFVLIIVLFLIREPLWALLSLVTDVLIAAIGLPEVFRRRRE
jgi:hypothetical protein